MRTTFANIGPLAMIEERISPLAAFLNRVARGKTLAASPGSRDRSRDRQPNGVAVLPIYGTLVQKPGIVTEYYGGSSTDEVGSWLSAAMASNVEAVVLDVDSPGGSVFGVEELGDKIAAASKKKRVIAVANSLAASGAFWLASQASELVVTPGGQVGSIGVFDVHVDESAFDPAIGRAVTIVKAGERKNAEHPYGPLDQTGRESMQSMVNDYYAKFVRAVARGRNTTQTAVRECYGRGGMVRAEEAIRSNMADTIGTLGDVLSRYGLGTGDLKPASSRASARASLEIETRRQRLHRDMQAKASTPSPIPTSKPLSPAPTPRWHPDCALHEAAHATAAVILGFRSLGVSIVEKPDSIGRAPFDNRTDLSAFDLGFGMAVIYLAGSFGDGLHTDWTKRLCSYQAGSRDRIYAADVCRDPSLLGMANERARKLVAENADAIRHVADALKMHGELSGADVHANVSRHKHAV